MRRRKKKRRETREERRTRGENENFLHHQLSFREREREEGRGTERNRINSQPQKNQY